MICPECVIKKLKSRVTQVFDPCCTLEVKYDHTYWDEKGLHHDHNHNTSDFTCSNGHEFTKIYHCDQEDCCDKT